MNKIRKLAGETALYGLGSIIPRMLNFFLVILHTRIFLPEAYGVMTNLYAWIAFLNIVYLFGMETAYFRYATREGADEHKVFRVAQTFVLLIAVLMSGAIIAFAYPLSVNFHLDGHSEFIIWIALIMLVDASVAIPFARLRLEKKAGLFALAKFMNVALLIGLNFYFLLFSYDASIGIGYVLIANLAANLFYLVFFFRTLISWRPAWDQQLVSLMFTYSYPVMLSGLIGMINEMFSRMTLQWWLPENFYPGKSPDFALGVFGACYRFSVIMNLAVQAFRFAAEPFFFSNAATKNSPVLFAKVNHYFTIVCCIILLGVVLNMDILKYLLDKSYWEGLMIVPILLTAYLFLGLYYNFSVWFKLTDKTYFGTLITAVGAILTILLNYLLIPKLGYVGSSWATLLCYFTMAAGCYALGQKYFPVPYRIGEGMAYLFCALILTQVSSMIVVSNIVLSFSFHMFIIIAFCIFVFWRENKSWRSPVE